jgi:hypothetical protein
MISFDNSRFAPVYRDPNPGETEHLEITDSRKKEKKEENQHP